MKARDANLKDRDGVIFSKLPTNSLSTRLRSTHMEESERQDGVDIQWLYLLMNLRVPATTASSQNHPTPSKNFPPSHHRVLGLDYSLYSRKWAEQTLKETEEKYYWEVNSAEEVHKLFHQNAEGDIDRIEYEDPKFATIIHRVKLGEILKSEPRGRLQSRLCINRDGSNVLYKRRNEETWTERLSLSGFILDHPQGSRDDQEKLEHFSLANGSTRASFRSLTISLNLLRDSLRIALLFSADGSTLAWISTSYAVDSWPTPLERPPRDESLRHSASCAQLVVYFCSITGFGIGSYPTGLSDQAVQKISSALFSSSYMRFVVTPVLDNKLISFFCFPSGNESSPFRPSVYVQSHLMGKTNSKLLNDFPVTSGMVHQTYVLTVTRLTYVLTVTRLRFNNSILFLKMYATLTKKPAESWCGKIMAPDASSVAIYPAFSLDNNQSCDAGDLKASGWTREETNEHCSSGMTI
ncbi:hypothetical protein PROFUN_12537 [Planoprotostelium fungivorum]|uniref:Uncharacterized protein n=1 Tax=Planoprotostelium fungivorum TaxID=1890364 RepID=A0A2P6MS50_9EUKA|nr:hypothetical protein PROFUN_12537 [Planoprotostelium fungivorum]